MIEEAIDYKIKYEELLVTVDELSHQVIHLHELEHELAQLKKLIFGSRSERFIPSASREQLALDLNVASEFTLAHEKEVQKIEYNRVKPTVSENVPVRMKLPASLPREEVILEPAEDTTGMNKIGDEITEELERIPGKLFVRRYIRPKYARANGEGVVISELPVRVIDKGIPGPGLLSQILIDKYVDHLPIYRQIQRFEREGMKLPSSTLTDWITSACDLLGPLYEALKEKVLSADYLQADETPIKVLDKDKKGSSHRGYHWVYHAPHQRLVLFDYREGRGREGPEEILKDFKGYLQTDGYAVYENFAKRDGITLLHCMAHARRKFDEAADNDKVRAEYAIAEIQKLYAVERNIKDESLSEEQAADLRKTQAVPVLTSLKEWMLENYKAVLPQSAIGQALHYSLQRWDKLMIYTTNGKLQIDNNLVENAIRPVALGRKNYLFAGSHNGARRAAMLYSFLGTCKINNVNPFDWMRDTLEKIPAHPVNQIDKLLPQNYKV